LNDLSKNLSLVFKEFDLFVWFKRCNFSMDAKA